MAEMTAPNAANVHADTAHSDAESVANQKLAMWLYLGSEIVIFSILIAGYIIYRLNQPDSVNLVHKNLGVALVTANTFILLASSFAMVMGLRAIEMGNRTGFFRWIGTTALLGVVFMGGQYLEYSELAHLGVTLERNNFGMELNFFEDNIELQATVTEENGATETVPLREALVLAPGADVPATFNPEEQELVRGEITSYTIDFEENPVFATIPFADYPVTLTVDQVAMMLDADPATEGVQTTLTSEQATDIGVTDDNPDREGVQTTLDAQVAAGVLDEDRFVDGVQTDLSQVRIETTGGTLYTLDTIFSGQQVTLAPAQYTMLNGYFRDVLADDVANFGMRFYAPTAFHGFHVFIGVLWALLIMWRGRTGHYEAPKGNAIGVELFGLYWHFVDVVWIFLFTLIYLI